MLATDIYMERCLDMVFLLIFVLNPHPNTGENEVKFVYVAYVVYVYVLP